MTEAISSKAGRNASPIWFFAIFALVGLAFLFFIFLRPAFRILEARSWNATPCVILSSAVGTHRGSKGGSTFSVDLVYRYTVEGRPFTAQRYHFLGGSSGGRAGKSAIVRRYPAGTSAVCYVNPRDPSDAVMERGFTSEMWYGLIPLTFVAIGVGGMMSGRRKHERNGTSPVPNSVIDASPRTLRAGASPLGKFCGVLVITLFWNGLISIFVAQMLDGWRRHHPDWFLTLFLIPFELIGLAFIVAVGHQFLALLNPRPALVVTPGAIRLGGDFEVQWRISGRAAAMRRLHIFLEGREEATRQNGKNTSTEKNVFETIEIAETTSRIEMHSGQARVKIPRDAMHSFKSGHNQIVWAIQVHGEISNWPDVKEEFPITILPLKT